MQGYDLQLVDADGKTLLEFTKAVLQAVLVGTCIGEPASTPEPRSRGVQGDATLTAYFQSDTVSGDGGCNSFNGPYTAGKGDISIGPLASTMKACTEDVLGTQEQHYLAALQLAEAYRIVGTSRAATRGRDDRGHVRACPDPLTPLTS